MFQSSDIYTVTEFSRKPAEHIKRLTESKRPEVLTVNGKAAVVVQDAETYEKMSALAKMQVYSIFGMSELSIVSPKFQGCQIVRREQTPPCRQDIYVFFTKLSDQLPIGFMSIKLPGFQKT